MVSSPTATSSLPVSSAANSKVNGPMVFACDSTVTAANGAASSAMRGRSSAGTARRSKKLLALYSFSRCGTGGAIDSSACARWVGRAPGGVWPSRVQRHRSQNEQVKGHSAPARNTVTARSTPVAERSSSTTVPCAFQGSTTGFGGRSRRIRASGVEGVEMAAIACLVLGEQTGGGPRRRRPMLEAPFGIDGHLESQHRAHASTHDFTLQGVETLVRAACQLGERYRLGDRDHGGPSVWAERDEAMPAGAGIAAHAAAAVTPRVGERVFERVHAPSFLIKHAVIDDASDRQLAVRLDRIVLEIFIAAIAVDEQPPFGVACADRLEQRQVHGGTFDVERFVVLDHGHGAQRIESARRHIDRLTQHFEIGLAQKRSGL